MSVLNGLIMGMFIPLIAVILDQGGDIGNDLYKKLLEFCNHYSHSPVPVLCAIIIGLVIFKNIMSYYTLLFSQKYRLELMSTIRSMTVEYLFKLPLSYVQNKKSGDMLLILNKHSGQTANMLEDVRVFCGHLFTLFFYICILINISTTITVFAIFSMLLFFFPTHWLYKRMKKLGDDALTDARNVSSFGIEMISGFRLIKESANEENEINRYHDVLKNFNATQINMGMSSEANRIATEVLGMLSVFAIILFWIFTQSYSSLDVISSSALFGFLIVFYRSIGPIVSMGTSSGSFATRLAGAKDLNRFLNDAEGSLQHTGTLKLKEGTQQLAFNSVSFKYGENLPYVLNNVSFHLNKGEHIAFVGESGSGKSTILNLIYGFNQPNSGNITVNNENLNNIDVTHWRKHIACVSQDTFLFNKTVKENILYGCDESNEKSYLQSLDTSDAKQFVNELPEQDNTMIGERGVRLSGGQAQRIAIARAVVKNPDILILDEATSALDSITESQVQNALENLSSSYTSITIAHRLSTVIKCDRIYVVDKGQIIEQGNHNQLLEINGIYANMWETQSKDEF